MSHFTVMVFGDDVVGQMDPFHEFECTGVNDQYVQDQDVTDELGLPENPTMEQITEALAGWGLEDKIVDDESKVENVGDDCRHKYGYAIVKDGKLIKAVNRTNPNKKWDWYQIGGRWSGMLRLKSGAQGEHGERSWTNRDEARAHNECDSALKKDIDFESIHAEAESEAGKRWDNAHAIIKGRTWMSWESVQKHIVEAPEGESVWDARRAFYNGQSVLVDLRKEFSNPFVDLDEYLTPRDQYVNTRRNAAITTFAFIKDGQWVEKGDMGWFGMVSDEKDQDDWNEQFAKMLDELPDDTRITIIDAHI